MSFARQKRLLLGLLAFLAPLPLPFNEVVAWPVLLLYLLGVAFFLRRAWVDPPRWLPTWGMNVLGLVYIPIFFLDLLVLSRGRLVQPVLHLCLYTLLVKLFSLVRERDKWQSAMGIFFLFLAGMGTSVHPLIVLYLIGFLVLSLVMLTRFAFLHVLAGFGREDPALARIPLGGFLTASTVLTLVLAVPLFAILPRVRSPYIVGRSFGGSTQIEAAGFSDEVTLDSIGQIRSSRQVALRLLEEGALDPDHEMRFKAASYDIYQGGTWRRSPSRLTLRRERVRFRLSPENPTHWVKIWLQPLRSRSLPVPVEATVVEPRALPVLEMDEGGALSFVMNPLEVREYRVGLIDRPVLLGTQPTGPDDSTLDSTGVTPRITELARRAMGTTGSVTERVRRLETYLIKNYEYTLDFSGRSTENPIEDFLFRYRSGQCEYFASSMVLMLRSQGISARLVTGFLGGEYNPFEGYFIVRDSNAHAWVEAYLPGEGWHIFDPTPPAGRPTAERGDTWLLAQQAWDFVLFRWDRYVLTYGLYDQLRIFGSLRNAWTDFWKIFDRSDKAEEPVESKPETVSVTKGLDEEKQRPSSFEVSIPAALALTLLAAGVYGFYLRFRPPLTATSAYRRLRRRLGRSGAPVPDSVPPQQLHREAGALYPAAAEPMAKVIDFYLRESFGGHSLGDDERDELKAALEEAEKGFRDRRSSSPQARRKAG
jgi:transglutaminase-like putative cysteine protease